MGSLVAALGSWLDAKTNDGLWLLRIEDLDPPREEPGAADSFPYDLDRLGLHWDGPVTRQSARLALYEDALQTLLAAKLAYRCHCSRRDIEGVWQSHPDQPKVYPGTCRMPSSPLSRHNDEPFSCRLNVAACLSPCVVEFDDRIRGRQHHDVASDTGDFVLRRRDGLHAYQLAVVVDDALQGVTDIVRGADLLDNTARQIVLQNALGYGSPRYAHLPVVLNASGQKLSKRSGATRIEQGDPGTSLVKALSHLGIETPSDLSGESPTQVLRWAQTAWADSGPIRRSRMPAR